MLRENLLNMRKRAEHLVSLIPRDVPGITVHNITHLDALWETASIIAGEKYPLNPAEAFVFGAAVLLHDAAMSLAAYPGGINEIKKTLEWRDAVTNRLQRIDGKLFEATQIDNPPEQIANASIADVLRDFHAKRAAELPFMEWPVKGAKTEVLIQDSDLREAYGNIIGMVAASHWWPISELSKIQKRVNAGPDIPASWIVDPLKIACLLRVADAAHIDQRRAPRFLRALIKPTGISERHWAFQEKLGKLSIEKRFLIYTGGPFGLEEAEAWWLCFDMIAMIDDELRAVNTLLDTHNIPTFVAIGVKGAKSPEAISTLIPTKSWKPVNTELRVTDIPAMIDLLGGEHLYGSDKVAAIRELIQNAADAIRAKRLLANLNPKAGTIKVRLRRERDGQWLDVEDDGIGMSPNVLTGALLDFGHSFWGSAGMRREFPGLQSKGLKTTGRYGIGFFSVFMLGEHVKVTTRRYDAGTSDTYTLDFRKGLNMRPILRQPTAEETLSQPGTIVSVLLQIPTDEPKGLLYIGNDSNGKKYLTPLEDFIASICPSIDVTVQVEEKGEDKIAVSANDWIEEQASKLVSRLSIGVGFLDEHYIKSLTAIIREIKDKKSGELYGRACICPKEFNIPNGIITVGGLRTTELYRILGVLLGLNKNVARNLAIPMVPAAILREWATEQAQLIATSKFTGKDKLSTASMVMMLGGVSTGLPIAIKNGEYCTEEMVADIIRNVNEVEVFAGDEIEYDEDSDEDVPPKHWDDLDISGTLFLVPNNLRPNFITSGEPKWPECLPELYKDGYPKGCMDSFLAVLTRVWGVEPEGEDCERVVGEVHGDEITRDVCVYSRPVDFSRFV